MPEFVPLFEYPRDKQAYVLMYPFDAGFAAQEKLKIVYHGELSDAVVAIRPEVESGAAFR